MRAMESNKRDIESRLKAMGDYVKIDYLSELLKSNLDYDTRRFVLLELAKLYKDKGMVAEAAKLVNNAAEINTTYGGIMKDHSVAMQLFIKAGRLDEADVSMNKAMAACNNEKEKMVIRMKRKDAIKAQAEEFLKRDKRKLAMLMFEKLNAISEMTADEKRDAQAKLTHLYEQLGKVREFYGLKRGM